MARPPMMAPMGMAMPPSAPMMAPAIPIRPPGIGGAPVPTEEPPSKKQKTEENLIPEDVFLQTHKVSFI